MVTTKFGMLGRPVGLNVFNCFLYLSCAIMVLMDYDEIFAVLGERFPDVKFVEDQGFGSVPVQAYGMVCGEYFYFRFRGNWGSLEVGPYVKMLADLYVKRIVEDVQSRVDAREATGEKDSMWDMFDTVEYQCKQTQREVDPKQNPTYLPILKTRYAEVQGADPSDVYNGTLDTDEFIDMFTKLMNNLEDVPDEKQLSPHTRIWLFEGRAAANKFYEDLLGK